MSEQITLFPGFVDLQVNGFLGVDYSSPDVTAEGLRRSFRGLIESGTMIFLPTIITSSEETYRRNLPLLVQVCREEEFRPHIPGLHLEGPFLSPEEGAVGAHSPDWIRDPDPEKLDRLIELAEGFVKLLTIAAERPGAARLCRHAVRRGLTVSLGHQLATADDVRRLADAGARALTHLGNGVPRMLDRHRNPIWAGLAEERLSAMIIPDGHHLPRELIRVILLCKGAEGTIAVSDASPIAGSSPGRYRTLGNDVILEPDGKLWNPDHGYLVGSSATMFDCMNHLASLRLLDADSLIRCGTTGPLELAGIDRAFWRALPDRIRYDGAFTIVK